MKKVYLDFSSVKLLIFSLNPQQLFLPIQLLTFSGFAASLENCTVVSTSSSVLSSSVAFTSLTSNSAAAEKEKFSD